MKLWKAIWDFEWGMASIGGGICLILMVFITVISVFGRYVMQMDLIPGAYNIIERIIFPLMIFWALPMAHREGTFPRLELLPEALSPKAKAALNIFIVGVEAVIYAILLYFVVLFVWNGIQSNRSMQIGINVLPLWPIIIMMPVAFVLMLLEMVRLIYEDFRTALGKSRA
jgi:TRAP-type C4-dicarboxylate transport system permease small subunit